MPKFVSIRPAYKILTSNYSSRTLLFFASYADFFLRNNKPVGKPFSYYHPEIRIVHVGSFVNAFLFFLRMCDQRLLTYRQTGEYLHCTAVFPDESGNLYFTNKVTCRNKENTVAVLKIDYVGLKPKITEIRFELNIKK